MRRRVRGQPLVSDVPPRRGGPACRSTKYVGARKVLQACDVGAGAGAGAGDVARRVAKTSKSEAALKWP